MTLQILSPAGLAPVDNTVSKAQRLTAVRGIRLGMLDNSKKNADALLTEVGAHLARAWDADVRLWSKGQGTGAAGAAPEATLREMSLGADAALVALGD
jgi:hypothetical protein